MAKTKKWELIKEYENVSLPTSLWFNHQTKSFEIWRNKASVKTLTYKGYVLFEDMTNVAKNESDEWVHDTEHANMTLNEYLQRNNLKITALELECLNCILGEGSFYEEGCKYHQNEDGTYNYDEDYVDRKYGSFIGWYIDESEVPGCRGALASLVKKGILSIAYDDVNGEEQAAYYIYFRPEFLPKGQGYHALKIDASNMQ